MWDGGLTEGGLPPKGLFVKEKIKGVILFMLMEHKGTMWIRFCTDSKVQIQVQSLLEQVTDLWRIWNATQMPEKGWIVWMLCISWMVWVQTLADPPGCYCWSTKNIPQLWVREQGSLIQPHLSTGAFWFKDLSHVTHIDRYTHKTPLQPCTQRDAWDVPSKSVRAMRRWDAIHRRTQ